MESEGDTTVDETSVAATKARPSRRSKTAVQTDRDKNQENIDGSQTDSVVLEDTITEDAKNSAKVEDKQRSSTPSSANSSTPRRRKDPLANLHSNLSPKYIGFVTPTSNLDNSTDERTRKTRRRHNVSNNADTSLTKDTTEAGDMAGQLFGSHDTSVGYVRRIPKDSNDTPDHKNGKRKEFVSPIEKLLKKNGSIVDSDMLPLDDCGKDNEQFSGEKCTGTADPKYQDVESDAEDVFQYKFQYESQDEEPEENNGEKTDEYSFTETTIETNENKEIPDPALESCCTEEKEEVQYVGAILETESNKKVPDTASDNYSDTDVQVESLVVEEATTHKPNLEITEENENLLVSEDDKIKNHAENLESEDEIRSQSEDGEEISNETETQVELKHSEPDEKNVDSPDSDMLLEGKRDTDSDELYSEPTADEQCTSEPDNNRTNQELVQFKLPAELSQSKEANDHDVKVDIVELTDTDSELPVTIEQKSDVKIEIDSADTESNNTDFAIDATSAKSPSAISMDSAKGSSILNEGSWMSFSTGDLFWGQIYNYCFWPCMVCPDPDGKSITTKEHISGDQHVMVHVRFFADNARRNWVRRENLMPFTTLEQYQERLDECREKHGPKSTKFRLYVPKKKKVPVWYEAIDEANLMADVPHEGRLEKFYEIFEKSKSFQNKEKQRRKSMYLPGRLMSASDGESLYGSHENVNNLAVSTASTLKRERSTSPYSPAYSPIKNMSLKKRKLSAENKLSTTSTAYRMDNSNEEHQKSNTMETSSSSSTKSLENLDIFHNEDFNTLCLVMKDFVLEGNQNEILDKSLLVAVRNIWALKQLSRQQMMSKLSDSTNEIESAVGGNDGGIGGIKRLSNRLKSLMARKSLISQRPSIDLVNDVSVTPKQVQDSGIVEKPKKQVNRPILEVIDDIFELDNKYLFKGMGRDPVCKYCFKPGGSLKRCKKNCHYWLHSDCLHKDFSLNGKLKKTPKRPIPALKAINDTLEKPLENNNNNSVTDLIVMDSNDSSSAVPHVTSETETEVICRECTNNEPSKCMVCNLTDTGKPDDPLVKCCMGQCDRAFHPACCKYWPQSKITISKNLIQSFRCPSHVCHTCVSDDPKGKFQQLSSSKTTKCVKCPATFHTDSTCIPAGSQILTAAHIICPRHASLKPDMTINVNWCFICVGGGQVVCCETCPTAVHAQCLKIPIDPNEGYICEECESGRMPLYGEMVWAKFTNFRWWPAIILPPTEIPQNIAKKIHNPSDFVVRFFGTHDHGWISRRRVYLYLEGDSSEPPKLKTSSLDVSYNRGLTEAKEVYEIIKGKKILQRTLNENKEKLHPQPYVRIKANRPVHPVKLHVDMESVSKCECNPNDVNPCGPETNCLNRVLYHECNPKVCPARDRCQNQLFESRKSPRLDVIYMKERGFGLVCRENIPAGSFVIEYVGEIINDDEFRARMAQKSLDRDENFYFLSVEKDYIIDAGPKGNLARFMNHSCDPNCETQKWSVNSLNRVGLFAIKDIPENTELTFNYHWDDLLGNEKKTCYCSSKKCSGQIGGKIRESESKEPSPSSDVAVKTKGKTKTKSKGKPLKRLHTKSTIGKRKPKTKLKGNAAVKHKSNKMAAAAALAASKSPQANPEPVDVDGAVKVATSSHSSLSPEEELHC